MSNYGTLLLSKIIDENSPQQLAKHNVQAENFRIAADREAFEFIREYGVKHGGNAPSYAAVIEKVPDFIFIPNVTDNYEYLTKQLLNDTGRAEFEDFIQNGDGLNAIWEADGSDTAKLIDNVVDKLLAIKQRSVKAEKVGTDLKADADKFLEEYARRKNGQSFRTWRSRFSIIGEYVSGNMYVIYGRSGRGKSVIAAVEEALEAAEQGATVLIWSMEMAWYEVLARLYVSLSGRQGLTEVEFNGASILAGFDANQVRNGQLAPEFEEAFASFIKTLNDFVPGTIIVRGVDDPTFSSRTVRQLESDIINTGADFVVVDPFYYLEYEKNASRTTGGDAAETSKKLRRLCGTTQTVILAITQADEVQEVEDADGSREISLPKRSEVKKTSALLEDATTLIAIDTDYKQGRGLIGINKGRNGGEGEVIEILYATQYGVVKELAAAAGSADDF